MPARTTRNVFLTPELDAFVDGQVTSGQYRIASEVVRTALRLLQARERRERRPAKSHPTSRPDAREA